MSDAERIAKAQAMIEEMVKRFGVVVAINNTVKRIDDGGVIVTPTITLQCVQDWKPEES